MIAKVANVRLGAYFGRVAADLRSHARGPGFFTLVAGTCVLGTEILLNARHWALLGELLPFLKGFTLFFWVGATWRLPLLLILGAWRHLVKRCPLTYDPQYWSMVFPEAS